MGFVKGPQQRGLSGWMRSPGLHPWHREHHRHLVLVQSHPCSLGITAVRDWSCSCGECVFPLALSLQSVGRGKTVSLPGSLFPTASEPSALGAVPEPADTGGCHGTAGLHPQTDRLHPQTDDSLHQAGLCSGEQGEGGFSLPTFLEESEHFWL